MWWPSRKIRWLHPGNEQVDSRLYSARLSAPAIVRRLRPTDSGDTVLVLADLDHAGVAAEALRGVLGEEGFADLAGFHRIAGVGMQAAFRDRERDLDRRTMGSIAAEVALGEGDERIGAVEGAPGYISALVQHARTIRGCGLAHVA